MKNRFYFGIMVIFCIQVIQAHFAYANADEAYYLSSGQNLSWIYFDQQPFVGLLTFLSYLVFDNASGLRFITTVIHLITLLVIWKCIDKENGDLRRLIYFFFIFASSLVMISLYGFITTQDTGLLFFDSMFFWSYKGFLQNEKWSHIYWIGLAMAGMMYSKFQGTHFIIVILHSNTELWSSFMFLSSAFLSLYGWSPHVNWRTEYNFPTLTYQLIYRSLSFKWYDVRMLSGKPILINNPVVWMIGFINLWKKSETSDVFHKTFYHIFGGFLVFFGLTPFQGHVVLNPTGRYPFRCPSLLIFHMQTRNTLYL